MEVSKEVILVLAGGLVTFLVTLIINKIQSKKPTITWRILPPVSFISQELIAFSINIENSGSKAARNLRAVIDFPHNAKIDSFEVQTSEKAMKYEILKSGGESKIEILFPYFNKGLECIFGFLTKNVRVSEMDISIVGDDDVIGKEKKLISPDETSRKLSRMWLTYLITTPFLVTLISFSIWSTALKADTESYLQQMDIAEIYIVNGRFDLALKEYRKIPERWWTPNRPRLYYKTALAYVGLNDTVHTILYLNKIKQSDESLFQFASMDKDFDNIRFTPEFIKLVAETNQTK